MVSEVNATESCLNGVSKRVQMKAPTTDILSYKAEDPIQRHCLGLYGHDSGSVRRPGVRASHAMVAISTSTEN